MSQNKKLKATKIKTSTQRRKFRAFKKQQREKVLQDLFGDREIKNTTKETK